MAMTSLAELGRLSPDELLELDQTPTIDDLRRAEQVWFDDVEIGEELPRYIRRRSIVELQRWSITMENTHRVHYDQPHALNHDKVPGALFHGTFRTSIICAWLKNWTLPGGWLWKASWTVRRMVVAGETTVLWGRITGKEERNGLGLVEIEFGILGEDGVEGCPGRATVALPIRGGSPVPYPFTPPAG